MYLLNCRQRYDTLSYVKLCAELRRRDPETGDEHAANDAESCRLTRMIALLKPRAYSTTKSNQLYSQHFLNLCACW